MLPAMLAEVFGLGKTDTAVLLKQGRFATGEHSEESAKFFKSDSQFMRKLKSNTLKECDLKKPLQLMAKNFELDENRLLELTGDSDIRSAYDALHPWLTGYNEALAKSGHRSDLWHKEWVNYLNRMFAQERERLDEIEVQTDIEIKKSLAAKHMNKFLDFDLSSVPSDAGRDFLIRSAVVMNLAAIVEMLFVSSINGLKEAKPIFAWFLPRIVTSKKQLSELNITNKELMNHLISAWTSSKLQGKKLKDQDFYEFVAIKECEIRQVFVDKISPDVSKVKQRINRWSKGSHYINMDDYHQMFYWARDAEHPSLDLELALFVTVTNLFTLTQVKAREYGLRPEFVAEVYSNYPYFYDDVRNDFIAVMSEMDSVERSS